MQALFPTFISLGRKLKSILAMQVKPDIAALWAKFEAAEEASWQRYQQELKAEGLDDFNCFGFGKSY